jgi:hypothetical protein
MNTSATSNTRTDALRSLEIKIKKVNYLESTINKMEPTRDGRFFILTRRQRLRLRD